ncbi:MAG: ATP-binding protein [Carnobacterium sp.]|nr:ATP-binding protein [Carnobacterium sp.]
MKRLETLKIANFKNIGEKPIGFDKIGNLNILVGQNNIGKSTLLQSLDFLLKSSDFDERTKDNVCIEFSYRPTDVEIKDSFQPSSSEGSIVGNHYTYGQRFINKMMTFKYSPKHTIGRKDTVLKNIEKTSNEELEQNRKIDNFNELALNFLRKNIQTLKIIKLAADRNLVPENQTAHRIVKSDGEGATNLLRQYLHFVNLDNKIVEEKILSALNSIMSPEVEFSRIMCQEVEALESKSVWEILLENENGKIPISSSGSGLRTILLVLIKIFLETNEQGREPKKIVYVFEELENNLHPSIQRNLFNFLHEWAIENDACVFITTHSNVPLNMFGGKKSVTITHLSKVNGELQTNSDFSFIKNENILMDLGVRASDILQSNAVIWVEGPSDRVYLNKWIELYSGGELKENIHYQILFYGGRLLSHLSGRGEVSNDLIQLFRANRHSIIMIDSDKRNQSSKINKTKQRIKKEFEEMNSLCWVTKGKEIENYLTKTTIFKTFGVNSQVDQYESIEEFLNRNNDRKKDGTKYIRNKVHGAVSLCKNMIREDLKILDLDKKIELIVEKIKEWNGL